MKVGEHQAKQSNYTILIKREGTASFWDSLMEVLSMTLSVDMLRMSSDSRSGDPFITVPADMPRTQVIILDEFPEGPVYNLWSLFAGSAPVRIGDILDDEVRAEALLSAHTAIIPLPGGSNPLAQIGEDDVPGCHNSALARTFARRVLQNYGVLHPQGGNSISEVVRVTFIARTGTRRIRNIDHLLQALHRAFPNIIAQAVDFAAIPMSDQLQIVQSTDILVGAHGAGLSHIMFMREGKGAVVEIQPAGLSELDHQARYKNLAAMMGQEYFLAEAEVVPFGQKGSCRAETEQGKEEDKPKAVEIELARRDTEIAIGEVEFVAQIGRAIKALVSRELASHN
ncbi:hypothetical protein Daus18300_007044 [Diaporthe australafricana]|uniref:EGF domain-specific O-linked N-acetylglucosamine transferase n=1 Tax=Diaporthe australafricana TaxID=127596 RepID=A0ABR3WPT2_9PEZI